MDRDAEKSDRASNASTSGVKTPNGELASGSDVRRMEDGDIEKQQGSKDKPAQPAEFVQETRDPNLVEFDGPDDPDDPRTMATSFLPLYRPLANP